MLPFWLLILHLVANWAFTFRARVALVAGTACFTIGTSVALARALTRANLWNIWNHFEHTGAANHLL